MKLIQAHIMKQKGKKIVIEKLPFVYILITMRSLKKIVQFVYKNGGIIRRDRIWESAIQQAFYHSIIDFQIDFKLLPVV